LLQLAKQTARAAVRTHSTNEPSRVCTTHLPSIPHPLRNRADPGGQKGQGCLTTLIPRQYRPVLAREPVHNHRTPDSSPLSESPRAQPVSVGPDSSRTTSMLPAKPSTAVEVALRVPSSPECISLRARTSGLSSCVWSSEPSQHSRMESHTMTSRSRSSLVRSDRRRELARPAS